LTKRLLLPLLLSIAAACASGPSTRPNDREWALLMADYQWIQTLRDAQKQPAATASRKEQIETRLENHRKIEPTLIAFMDKVREYHDRTADPRAASVLAKEKVIVGDDYMNLLARYDRAMDLYREALELDPANEEAKGKLALAERRRFVTMSSFATLKAGMREQEVRSIIGLPREDWIKQVVQNGRVYSVWIYPKADGGASAVYFDNGVVYHTNWNAAAPPAPVAQTQGQ
jgi:tetratricopeptide (TPR) repeat protein